MPATLARSVTHVRTALDPHASSGEVEGGTCGNLAGRPMSDPKEPSAAVPSAPPVPSVPSAPPAPPAPSQASLVRALSALAATLVGADGGSIYVVRASADDVHLHLTGTCAGCPGSTMTRDRLLEPVVRAVLPKAAIKVTTGWNAPAGAEKVEPAS